VPAERDGRAKRGHEDRWGKDEMAPPASAIAPIPIITAATARIARVERKRNPGTLVKRWQKLVPTARNH
jgi:hypothetical protein